MVDTLEVTAQKIRALQVQGARNVAIAAIHALQTVADQTNASDKPQLLTELKAAQTLLNNTRPTEPLMRNALRYIITQTQKEPAQDIGTLRGVVAQSADGFLKNLSASHGTRRRSRSQTHRRRLSRLHPLPQLHSYPTPCQSQSRRSRLPSHMHRNPPRLPRTHNRQRTGRLRHRHHLHR